jgi:hypothetical protein
MDYYKNKKDKQYIRILLIRATNVNFIQQRDQGNLLVHSTRKSKDQEIRMVGQKHAARYKGQHDSTFPISKYNNSIESNLNHFSFG